MTSSKDMQNNSEKPKSLEELYSKQYTTYDFLPAIPTNNPSQQLYNPNAPLTQKYFPGMEEGKQKQDPKPENTIELPKNPSSTQLEKMLNADILTIEEEKPVNMNSRVKNTTNNLLDYIQKNKHNRRFLIGSALGVMAAGAIVISRIGSLFSLPDDSPYFNQAFQTYVEERQKEDRRNQKDPKKMDPLEMLVDVTGTVLHFCGHGGGYALNKPKEYLVFSKVSPDRIPYYLYNGEVIVPEIPEMEKDLSNSIKKLYIDALRETGILFYDETDSKINIETKIEKGGVNFKYNMKFVKDSNVIKTINTRFIRFPSKLYEMREIAYDLAFSLKDNPKSIPVSKITDMAKARGLTVEIQTSDDQVSTELVKICKPQVGSYRFRAGNLSSKDRMKRDVIEDESKGFGLPEEYFLMLRTNQRSEKKDAK